LDDVFWDVLASEARLMPHLHLSVQAGSDLVLKRMKRRHSRAGALAVIARARRVRPGVSIGADLIAGFPTETDALFAETLAFVDEASVPYVHVFPYSERPGTPAARMPQVPVDVRRARAAALRGAALVHAGAFHAAMLGTEQAIVVERGGRGHTEAFAPVRFRTEAEVGALVTRRVVAAGVAGVEVL
jgi:threonylcarbamoyladenosine tRNA methylthiotransferase MtaB